MNQTFFTRGVYDGQYLSKEYRGFSPTAALTTRGPIEFVLPGGAFTIYINNARVYGCSKIVNKGKYLGR